MKQSISKEFFLHLGLIASLYTTVTSLLVFIFSVINIQFPDALNIYRLSSSKEALSLSLAILIVSFPIFVILSKYIYKDMDEFEENRKIWIRKWFLSLTLFLSSLVFAITIVVALNTYLSGDTSTRFLLKIGTVLILTSFTFWFYIKDYQGYFFENKSFRKNIINIITIIMLAGIISGLVLAGSPKHARDLRLDKQRVSDLSSLSRNIDEYAIDNKVLPENLDVLPKYFHNSSITDPETEKEYVYKVLNDTKYQLCAEFKTETDNNDGMTLYKMNPDLWNHNKGTHCFDREVYMAKGRIIESIRY